MSNNDGHSQHNGFHSSNSVDCYISNNIYNKLTMYHLKNIFLPKMTKISYNPSDNRKLWLGMKSQGVTFASDKIVWYISTCLNRVSVSNQPVLLHLQMNSWTFTLEILNRKQ